MRDFGIEGKVAMITGAAGGIGFEIAKTFAQGGARLALIDKSDGAETKLGTGLPRTEEAPLVFVEDLSKAER